MFEAFHSRDCVTTDYSKRWSIEHGRQRLRERRSCTRSSNYPEITVEVIEKNHEKCQLIQTTTWLTFEKQCMLQISSESAAVLLPQGSQWCGTDLNILGEITSARGSSTNLQHTESSYRLFNSPHHTHRARTHTHIHKFFFCHGNMELLSLSVLNNKRCRRTPTANEINAVIYFPFFLRSFFVPFPPPYFHFSFCISLSYLQLQFPCLQSGSRQGLPMSYNNIVYPHSNTSIRIGTQ